MSLWNSCVIGRDNNVLVVDFTRKSEPPAPRFPGANALRIGPKDRKTVSACCGAGPPVVDLQAGAPRGPDRKRDFARANRQSEARRLVVRGSRRSRAYR